MENRPHIPTSEAARVLGCTNKTVIKLFRSGKLEGFQLSPRIIRIYRDSIVNVLEGANNEPNSTNA